MKLLALRACAEKTSQSLLFTADFGLNTPELEEHLF